MNPAFKNPFTRYFAPAGDDGTDNGGAAADVAVLDDDDYMALPEAERRRLRGDGDTPEPSPGPTATTEGEGGEEDTEQEHAVATADNDEPGSDKGGNGIPRTRFNEVNKKRQALEAEVEELRAQLAARDSASAAAAASPAQSQKLSIAQAEEEYGQLLVDGDTKAAAALRVQINAAIEEQAFQRHQSRVAADKATTDAQSTVTEMMSQFPWLDEPGHSDTLDLIEAAVAMKMQRGMSTAEAVRAAVLSIAPRFAPNPGDGQQGAVSEDTRAQRANQRGAAHSMQQPALPVAGMGNRATPATQDTSKLTDEEYYALPEEERKKARGDY